MTLKKGSVVRVVDTILHFGTSRVRGKIDDGWISMLNTSNGHRWVALKERPSPFGKLSQKNLSKTHHLYVGSKLKLDAPKSLWADRLWLVAKLGENLPTGVPHFATYSESRIENLVFLLNL